MRRRPILYYGIVILQLLFLVGLAVNFYAVGWFGEEILLKTEPIDPRDLFYGDYVTLNYEINSIPISLWKGEREADKGDPIFVVLEPKDGYYHAVAAFPKRPEISENQIVLKGKLEYNPFTWNDDEMRVRYGIERFYIAEGTGEKYEERDHSFGVAVKVAPWGQVKVERLLLD